MDRCCRLSAERTITPGQYLETVLETQSGSPLHAEEEFVDQLAEFIMERYEGSPISDLKSLPGVKMNRPSRTKHHYRRLFNDEGAPTLDFLTWSSETIALWIEKTLAGSVYAEAGLPHASDPAYDVLSILRNGNGPK